MDKSYLNADKIMSSLETLTLRVSERFPDSGLYRVSLEITAISRKTHDIIAAIEKPNRLFRALLIMAVTLTLLTLGYGFSRIHFSSGTLNISEFFQASEAGLNLLILLTGAIVFLISTETRIKRRKVIKALNRLRAIAHVIDAHQLTKDPDMLDNANQRTTHSPVRELSPFLLGRYLNYCSELLAWTSKIGFLYIQRFDDPTAVDAVNDLENLTTGLARKIWQKIMILNNMQLCLPTQTITPAPPFTPAQPTITPITPPL